MRFLIFTLLAGLLSTLAQAQTARLQLIHNAPDPTVDVYVNGILSLDNIAFRQASPFITVPAGLPLEIAVAPGASTSSGDAVYTQNITFEDGKTYIAVAIGKLSDPLAPFHLSLNAAARETATDTAKVDVAILHGALNAPAVDIDAWYFANLLVDSLPYGQFTPYLSLEPGQYDFAVRADNDQNPIGRYRADLRLLKGKSAYLFASGVLGGNPAFGLFAALADGTVLNLAATPLAKAQLIHNTPDPTLDLYAGDQKIADDWVFRSATPYLDVPADRAVSFRIAGSNSSSVADAFLPETLMFETGKTYAVFATGVVFGNPAYGLLAHESKTAGANPLKIDFSIHHGAPGAPAVNVEVFEGATLATNLAYGQFSAPGSLDTGIYYLQVKQSGANVLLGTWLADFRQLGGKAVEIFASGYIGGAPAFGLYAALADGTVVALPATASPPVFARLQLIQNSTAGTIDVYANEVKLVDNLAFQSATAFLEIRKGAYNLAFAPANSSSANDAFYTLPVTVLGGRTYIMMSAGIPNNPVTPFGVIVNDQAKETAPFPFGVDVSFWHGLVMGANFDIDALYEGTDLADNLGYGQFTPYISLGPQKYDFVVRPHDSSLVLQTYRADLSGIIGQTTHIFFSSLPSGNPEFGLFAAYNDGRVVALPLTPLARVQLVHNAIDPTIDVYVGNTLIANDLEYRKASTYLSLPADRPLRLGVAGAGSSSAFDVLFPFTRSFETGKSQVVFANGIVFDTLIPLSFVQDTALEATPDPNKVAFAFFHGAPKLPNIDLAIYGSGNLFIEVPFANFTAYTTLNPGTYYVQIKLAGQTAVLKTFEVGLDSMAGRAFRLFLSGLAPDIRLFGAFSDGEVIEFPSGSAAPAARAQFIHNSPSATVDVYFDNTLRIDNFEFRKATPFIDVAAGRDIEIGLAPENSTSPLQIFQRFKIRFVENKTYILNVSGLSGANLVVDENGRETAPAPNTVSMAVFHGVPNAPAVDVDAVFVADNVVSNLAYGQFTAYLDLPAALYDLAIRPHGGAVPVATYRADLSALGGQAAYLFASGLLSGTPNFGLFAALPDGRVLTLPATPLARVQLLHNAPSAAIDVYTGNTRLLDNFEFRKATTFLNLPAKRPVVFGIAPESSQSAGAATVNFTMTFDSARAYLVSAIGILGGTPALDLAVNAAARESALTSGKTEITVLHGAIDAPAIDVDALLVANNLVAGLGYAQYSPYLAVAPEIQDLSLRAAGNPNVLGTYRADLSAWADQAICVFASGILNGSPALGLYALLRDGTVLPLPAAPTARVQFIHNAPEATVDLYGGSVRLYDNLQYHGATPFVMLPADRPVNLGFGGETSQSAGDAFVNFPRTFEGDKVYTVMITGLDLSLQLYTDANTREKAQTSTLFDVQYFNGVPDAGNVNVVAYSGDVAFSNVAYGVFAPYLSVPTVPHLVSIQAGSNVETVVVEGMAGASGTVFSTGLLNGAPAFRTWMALADGTTYPLPFFVGTQTLGERLTALQLSPNPASAVLTVRFDLKTAEKLGYRVRNGAGQLLRQGDWGLGDIGPSTHSLEVADLPQGLYLLEIHAQSGRAYAKFMVGGE